ncbi:type 2 isopentenyl-diphosphate Delta-isomerase [Salipaludibacillus sp. CF4.18]|uniref:type 2 isopentenyl-diphosphate Delta-isomerase n=1 Tax=Salipaludibacillus sp. CF4.18 TaxID=3373081 RepID=UPI003EE4426E
MSRSKRKLDHIEHALSTGQSRGTGLDDIRFIHQSFPNISVDEVSLSTEIGELSTSSPIFINAMTGGGGSATEKINRELAQLANMFHIPMAVGSQMAAIKDKTEQQSYKVVRQQNPTGIIFANLGSEASVDQAKFCVDLLEADALQIHMNVIQELVMPEGDRNFTGALRRIEQISNQIEVPVIVKEVGFGMSRETAQQLKEIGVSIIDVGGLGGTNFSLIENARRDDPMTSFDNWGIPTAVSIAEVKSIEKPGAILASGGIQNAHDIAKVIALGAESAGMAGNVLKWIRDDGIDRTIVHVESMLKELRFIMTALGVRSIQELQKSSILISGRTKEWLVERRIDTTTYANRR